MKNFDFDQLVEIEKSNSRTSTTQRWDLTYSPKTERFSISQSAFSLMGLENKGLTVFQHPMENTVFLAVRDEEHSKFLKTKKGATNKGNTFKNTELRKLLDQFGITTVGMNLVKAGEKSGTIYYVVEANNESGQLADLVEEETSAIVEEESDEEVEA